MQKNLEIGSVISQLGWPYNQGFHCNSNVIISTNDEVLQYVQSYSDIYVYLIQYKTYFQILVHYMI